MIRQIKNTFSKSSHRPSLSGDIKFYGLTKLFHIPLHLHLHLLLLLHLPLLLLFFNCNTNEPPKDNGAITLSVEDASCIEAWINLKVENITLPAAVTLKQSENNGEEKVRQIINLTTADTLLFIDSLLPKRSYKFKAEWINNSGKLKTAEATTVTMDTTSHNFTWQTFTFGQHSSSVLYDVAIINENNIWDTMALIPIIKGAGGIITDYEGNDVLNGNSAIAASKVLHGEVIKILNDK